MKKAIYILIGILLLIIPLTCRFKSVIKEGTNVIENVIELSGTTEIQKSFIAKYNGMENLAVQFATFNNQNIQGEIEVIIEDVKVNKKIYNQKINLKEINDNGYYIFRFQEQKNSKNKEYKITIETSKLKEENKIAIWGYDNPESKVLKNGKNIDIDFAIQYDCKKNESKLFLYFFIYMLVMGLIILLKEDKKA